MLFRIFVLLNLDLLTHARHRRQEIDARDMAASGRICNPPPPLPRHRTFFSITHMPTGHSQRRRWKNTWRFLQKLQDPYRMSVPRSSSSLQNTRMLWRMCREEISSSYKLQRRTTKMRKQHVMLSNTHRNFASARRCSGKTEKIERSHDVLA